MKRSLAVLALAGLVAMPVDAQDPHVWSDARPDAVAPLSVHGARMLPAKAFHIGYRYGSASFEGLQLGTQRVAVTDILEFYDQVPFERKDIIHELTVGVGMSEKVSLLLSASVLDRRRGQIDSDALFNFYETSGVSDMTADLLIQVYDNREIRSAMSLGFDIPTGSIEETGTNLNGSNTVLPFDAQLGTGSVAFRPGMSAMVQNEHATVGAQVQGRFYLNDNSRGYRWGNGVDATLWGAYMANSAIAVTGGVNYRRFGDFSGADDTLDPYGDPGQDPIFTAGTRVELPVGFTLSFPSGGLLAGASLQAEWVFPVHQDYDRPTLRDGQSFRIGISRTTGG